MQNFIKENAIVVAIVFASLIIGGFYYASQISKQASIERQQLAETKIKENELKAKKDSEDAQLRQASAIRTKKADCVAEATAAAVSFYKKTCKYSCQPEFYYVWSYDGYYEKCLQRNGLL